MMGKGLTFAERTPGGDRHYALITGASQGLGRALAHECARRGMNLVLVALPSSGLEHVAHEIEQRHGVHVGCIEMDLTANGSPEALYGWLQVQKVQLSILINNAGVVYNTRFEDSTLSENETCILLNNLATVKITHLLLPELKRCPSARILNVASLAAFFPMPYMLVYAASKAFVLNFSLALRAELRHTPVRVSVLCPNGIRTNRYCQDLIAANGLAARLTCMDPDDVARYAVRGMLKGTAVIVPGALNQFIGMTSKFVPRSAVYHMASIFWGRSVRRREAGELAYIPRARSTWWARYRKSGRGVFVGRGIRQRDAEAGPGPASGPADAR
jgi:short-subunit dehydrogenase